MQNSGTAAARTALGRFIRRCKEGRRPVCRGPTLAAKVQFHQKKPVGNWLNSVGKELSRTDGETSGEKEKKILRKREPMIFVERKDEK